MGVCCTIKWKNNNQIFIQFDDLFQIYKNYNKQRCSNKKSNNIQNTYGFLSPTNRQLEQDEYEELSVEIKEILEMYLSCEKNSPQNKNLGESNQLKHSLEQPNTPYFKNSYDSDDKFLYLKQSKQVEEIIRSSHKNSDKLPPVEEENEQQKQYSQSKHPIFQFKCLVCHNDHDWIHSCNSRLVYNDDNMIVCEKCKFKQKITEYDFTDKLNLISLYLSKDKIKIQIHNRVNKRFRILNLYQYIFYISNNKVMKNKNQQIQYLNKYLQKKAELVRHKSQYNTSISLMSIEKSKQFRPKKGPIDLSVCVTLTHLYYRNSDSCKDKQQLLAIDELCMCNQYYARHFFQFKQKVKSGKRILQVYYYIANGKQNQSSQNQFNLLNKLIKGVLQSKKKLSQDDGGGCC